MNIRDDITAEALLPRIRRLWDLSAVKLERIEQEFDDSLGAPVFTVDGLYTARGWTEWTLGFRYGSMLLQFDATGDETWLRRGRDGAFERMTAHLTHRGVHDHGFNTVSTFGNLLRLMREGRIPEDPWQRCACELAVRTSAAVQAMRWTRTADGGGFIYSFNGPHSLFADTIRTLRVLALGHLLEHVLLDENDRPVSLLERLILHARATARWNVYYGEGRDTWDVPGRVAHESIFNVHDGNYRCPNSQQGYSPFTTWTRGLAWIILGFAEQLEFLDRLDPRELEPWGGPDAVATWMERAAVVSADFYIENTCADGIPFWDTGAPGLSRFGEWRERPSDPFNDFEPVDSSAAAIAAQGLLRLGQRFTRRGVPDKGRRYIQAGLTVLATILEPPYLSENESHHGLILHSVYHRPNGWDHVPAGRRIPCAESSMWGDYHAREAALLVQRLAAGSPWYAFWRI